MKRSINIGITLAASFFSIASAENFNGIYVGASLGPNVFQSHDSQSRSDNINGNQVNNGHHTATLLNYGFFAGYGVTKETLYLGADLSFTFNQGESETTSENRNGVEDHSTMIKEGYSFNPTIRLGTLISPQMLLFIKLGVAGTQIKGSATPIGGGYAETKNKKTLWGYSMGLGGEMYATENISIRADYTFNLYPTQHFNVATATPATNKQSAKISPRDNIFRLGVTYNF